MQLWGIRIKRLHGLRKATTSDLTQVSCSGRASILSVLTRALGILRAGSDSLVESGNLMFRITRSERVSNSAISKCTYPVSACRPFALRQLTPPPVPPARILEARFVSELVSFAHRQLTIHDDMQVYIETQAHLSNVAFIEADDAALIGGNRANL